MSDTLFNLKELSNKINDLKDEFDGSSTRQKSEIKNIFKFFIVNTVHTNINNVNNLLKKMGEDYLKLTVLDNVSQNLVDVNEYNKYYVQIFINKSSLPIKPLVDANFIIEVDTRENRLNIFSIDDKRNSIMVFSENGLEQFSLGKLGNLFSIYFEKYLNSYLEYYKTMMQS